MLALRRATACMHPTKYSKWHLNGPKPDLNTRSGRAVWKGGSEMGASRFQCLLLDGDSLTRTVQIISKTMFCGRRSKNTVQRRSVVFGKLGSQEISQETLFCQKGRHRKTRYLANVACMNTSCQSVLRRVRGSAPSQSTTACTRSHASRKAPRDSRKPGCPLCWVRLSHM